VSRPARRLGWAALCAAGAAACGLFGDSRSRYEPSHGSYDRLPEIELEHLVEARALLEDGLPGEARAVLAPLAARRPENLPVAILLQEIELELSGEAGASTLAAEAAARAEAHPTLVTLLLASRLEADDARARALALEALAIDPRSAWCEYALAHLEARSGRWVEAEQRLARALERDPGLIPARLLEASLLARDGKRPEAIDAFEAWLAATEGDAFVDPNQRFLAALDLAQLYLLEGESGRARSLLTALIAAPPECRARELVILAAVEQARGNPADALRAARRAETADPDEPLAVVQQAELYELELDDPERAREKWRRLLEIASETGDLRGLLLSMRARVAIERGEERAEAAVRP
jgi:tetratricopeptide (TPR) repeat protein